MNKRFNKTMQKLSAKISKRVPHDISVNGGARQSPLLISTPAYVNVGNDLRTNLSLIVKWKTVIF